MFRAIICIALLCATSFGATVTNEIISPNGMVQTFNGFAPFASKGVVHTIGGSPVTISETSVFLDTTLYWVDGVPYVGDSDGGELTVFALPDLTVTEPTTSYPESFAAFAPELTEATYAADTPEIIEWTRRNNGGDTMALTSEGLNGTFAAFVFYSESSYGFGGIQSLSGRQVALTLPDALTTNDFYLMWGFNENGFGEPVGINQTEAWWIGMDVVAVGESFSVFGQNLDLGDSLCQAYIVGHGWVENSSVNPYKADFICPSLTAGDYTLYVHNGHGGKYGWSEAKTITVEADIVWDGTTFNVTSYGAVGDGATDDMAAIQNAVTAANNTPWSTIYFPEGEYLIDGRVLLNGTDKVRFLGDGTALSILKPKSLLDPYPMLQLSNADDIQFESMTIESGGFGDYEDEVLFKASGGEGLTFTNFSFVATNTYSMLEHVAAFDNNDRILFDGCTFYIGGMGYWHNDNRRTIYRNNTFIGIHDCDAMLGFGGEKIAIENNVARPWDTSDPSEGLGWTKGRFVSGGLYGTSDVYVGGNVTTNMCPRVATPWLYDSPTFLGAPMVDGANYTQQVVFATLSRENLEVGNIKIDLPNMASGTGTRGYDVISYDKASGVIWFDYLGWEAPYIPTNTDFTASIVDYPDGNSGERIMFEGGNTSWRGEIASATSNTVTMTGYSADQEPDESFVKIVKGRGLGQTRAILSSDTDTITLESNWRVIPDTSSVLVAGKYANNYVVYDNIIDGTPYDKSTTPAGVQITGGGRMVIDGNTITETRGSINLFAESQDYFNSEGTVNPIFFCEIKNNTATDTLLGMRNIWGVSDAEIDEYTDDLGLLGNVWRNNSWTNIETSGISMSAASNDHVGVTIADNNNFSGVDTGAEESSYNSGMVLVGNDFIGTGDYGCEDGTVAPVLIGNSWSGFTADYNSTHSSFVIPVTAFITNASAQTCTIQNTGTESISFTSSLGDSGTVAAEASDSFTFTASSATTFTVSVAGVSTQTVYVVEE